MHEVKTWAEIDASPLLQLPPEQRKALKETQDERFRAFWADCFTVLLSTAPQKEEEHLTDAFCEVFVDAFLAWEPKPGQTFSVYLRSAVKHQRGRFSQEEDTSGFRRETNRKVKKALEYMERCGISETMLAASAEKAQLVADIAGIGVKTLLEALRSKQSILSLDDTGGADSTLGERLADDGESVEQQVEHSGEVLQWLCRGIGLMDLTKKEEYGKTAGPLWSSVLLGYLRNEDRKEPAEDAPSRLANCDDLRPLEQENCLWDILLLRSYVAFTVCPPHAPEELEHAALNALLEADRNPAQDKTVAAFLGVSRAAVSQRRKTWQKKLLQLKTEQEEC